MKVLVLCLSASLGIGFSGARAAAPNLANDEQKTLYAIGVALSQSLHDFSLSEAELEIVKSGLSDGVLKRSIKGTYVSVEPFHLFRYLDEQAFRYNQRHGTDADRFSSAVSQIVGKRLTYAELTGKELQKPAEVF